MQGHIPSQVLEQHLQTHYRSTASTQMKLQIKWELKLRYEAQSRSKQYILTRKRRMGRWDKRYKNYRTLIRDKLTVKTILRLVRRILALVALPPILRIT